jgi:hypothetical protein
VEKDKWIYYILLSAGTKFGNKSKFRYNIPAYTGPFRALDGTEDRKGFESSLPWHIRGYYPGIRLGTRRTRLEKCTLWSTLIFHMCSSRRIMYVIVALSSDVIVERHVIIVAL